ncbi:CapA family protein [Desulfovibrio sp. OttesenSCG-928-A18]|nr:CapA family protein [Desulfovibrio sp. OttesenSCG-928-A18]
MQPLLRPLLVTLLCAGLFAAQTLFAEPAYAASGAASAKRTAAPDPAPPPLEARFKDRAPFDSALAQSEGLEASRLRISGLLVPYDPASLAASARAFALVRGQDCKRVLILAGTDENTATVALTAGQDLLTALGPVALDFKALQSLQAALPPPRPPKKKKSGKSSPEAEQEAPAPLPQLALSAPFASSLPVQSVIPLVRACAPGALVLPVGIPRSAGQKEWDALYKALRPLVGKDTLVVLCASAASDKDAVQARKRDQLSMRVLASGKAKLALDLAEPAHMDSRGGLYIMMRLQKEQYKSRATVLDNIGPQAETGASALVAAYAAGPLPVNGDLIRYFAGGDFFTGRGVAKLLANPTRRELLVKRILERTGGKPLIVNFEGVLMDPEGTDPRSKDGKGALPTQGLRLWMPEESTLALLRELNIVGVSLANNHTYDFGKEAYEAMQKALEDAGIHAPGHGEFREFPLFTLAAATDLDNNRVPYAPLLQKSDLALLAERNPDKPMFAMLHMGNEYKYTPNARARQAAGMLEEAGAELIIGHHPHMTGPFEASLKGFQAWSLGNFVFDQVRSETDGALLEIIFFDTGAYWVRQLPAENMYRNFKNK